MIDRCNIDQYEERFSAGDTTAAEEEAIYRFFAAGKIPRHLRRYKKMFAWYAGRMPYDPSEILSIKQKRREKAIFWSAAAAVAAIVTSLSFALINNSSSIQREYKIYEGSYVEVDGRKIRDLRVIMPQIRKIESHCNYITMSLDIDNDPRFAALHSEAARLLTETHHIEQTVNK